MVECQWDSVVPSPYSPVLTGLELTFMGVTQSYSGLFSTPGFIVSPVEKENGWGERGSEGWEKGNKRKGRKEEGIKKDRRQDKKELKKN